MGLVPYLSLIEGIVSLFAKRRSIKDIVLPLVAQAAADGALPDNAARRAWVLRVLMDQYGMPEAEARRFIETALAMYKRVEAKRARKEARKARRES